MTNLPFRPPSEKGRFRENHEVGLYLVCSWGKKEKLKTVFYHSPNGITTLLPNNYVTTNTPVRRKPVNGSCGWGVNEKKPWMQP
jgi:hypothetical protein